MGVGPEGKTLATLDEATLPERVRRQWPALLAGDFIERNENILAFGSLGCRVVARPTSWPRSGVN